jgi:O-antigen ligase
MTAIRINFRLIFLCFAAVAVALPVGIVSLAKLFLFLFALTALSSGWWHKAVQALPSTWTTKAILLALWVFAASLIWTIAEMSDALHAIEKHGKLLMIPILLSMIRSRREALIVLACFGAGQLLLLASTWLLVAGMPIPWAISREHVTEGSRAVFSSYLDQSIMTGVAAGICWHLRNLIPSRHSRAIAIGVVVIALTCIFFVFPGRTGHAVAIALVSLAIMWELPRRYRLGALLIPLVLLLALVATSSKVRGRLNAVSVEVQAFNQTGDTTTSSGTRLNLWQRSIQAMSERPWIGSGVGSWEMQYNRLQQKYVPTHQAIKVNPHQEYLMWGVELGVLGIALLLGIILSIYRDSRAMLTADQRALQSSLLGLTVACLFNSSLYDALIGDYFCIVLGLLLALGMQSEPSISEPSKAPVL